MESKVAARLMNSSDVSNNSEKAGSGSEERRKDLTSLSSTDSRQC
jgi:hypothetical protein